MKSTKKLVLGIATSILISGIVHSANYSAIFADDSFTFISGYNYDSKQEYAPVSEKSPEEMRDYGLLESKYPSNVSDILKSYPVVKNQGNHGTCWAFASIGTAELFMNKKQKLKPDYSELALAYNTYASVNDPLGGLKGDQNSIKSSSGDFLSYGGNSYKAFMTLFKWFGPSDERVAPYNSSSIERIKSKGMTMKEAINDAVHIENMSMIDITQNPEKVKQQIKENGSVAASIIYDSNAYNKKTNAYYGTRDTKSGHAIMIVGWDDNFKAENFNTKPKGKGAWLVRNSWGDNSFSEKGYFWISYYDIALSNLRKTVYSVTYNSKDKYNNNYQYDGSIMDEGLTGSKKITAANIFKVHSGVAKENLLAIAVGIKSADTKYTIDIYKNPKDANPTSGSRVAEAHTVGEKSNAGMYTIPLRNSVMLNKNDVFSVVVTLESQKQPSISVEKNYDDNGLKTIASISKGQSFYKKDSGTWNDLCQSGYGNVRIKAFTNNVKGEAPLGWHYDAKLKAMQYYIKEGEYVKGWKLMDLSTKETTPHYSFFNLKNGALYTSWHNMGAAENEKKEHMSYFGNNGWLRTGWKWMDSKEGEKIPHWSYFGSNGWLRTGWVQMGKGTSEPDDGKEKHWSYFGSNGWLRTGWVQMGKGTSEPDDGKEKHWSYFGSNGWLRTGWVQLGKGTSDPDDGSSKHWSYFGDNGWLRTNCTLKINGKTYTFDGRGWLTSAPIGL